MKHRELSFFLVIAILIILSVPVLFFLFMYNLLHNEQLEFDIAKAYTMFDIDQNGSVSLREFGIMSSRLGYLPPIDQNISTVTSEADVNGDALIDFDEFSTFFTTALLKQSSGSADPFLLFDINNDGMITREELIYFINSFGVNSTASDIRRMMNEADTNQNGVLDHAEFDRVVNFDPK